MLYYHRTDSSSLIPTALTLTRDISKMTLEAMREIIKQMIDAQSSDNFYTFVKVHLLSFPT